MTGYLMTGTIIVLLELIIIIYQVSMVVRMNNENEQMKKDYTAFKHDISKMYSENISDIIIENQKTLSAINNFIRQNE